MSKQNVYEIFLTDPEKETQIKDALERTDIAVTIGEDRNGNPKLTAKDAPEAGAAFRPDIRYIHWSSIKSVLSPYTEAIDKVIHTLSDDTGCFTKTKEYAVMNGTFVKTSEETEERF